MRKAKSTTFSVHQIENIRVLTLDIQRFGPFPLGSGRIFTIRKYKCRTLLQTKKSPAGLGRWPIWSSILFLRVIHQLPLGSSKAGENDRLFSHHHCLDAFSHVFFILLFLFCTPGLDLFSQNLFSFCSHLDNTSIFWRSCLSSLVCSAGNFQDLFLVGGIQLHLLFSFS